MGMGSSGAHGTPVGSILTSKILLETIRIMEQTKG